MGDATYARYGYILLAMKHVYAEPWSRTLIKYTLLLAGYFVLGIALMVLAIAAAMVLALKV